MSSLTTSLAGKVTVITGSSRGIGAAIALRLAEEGANVVINYVNSSSAAEKIVSTIKSQGKGDAIAIKADLSAVEGGKQLLDESMKVFGKIDALILNAAVANRKLLADVDESHYDMHFSTNVKTPLFTVKHAVDKEMFPPTGGRILFFSSSLTGNSIIPPFYLVYVMTKGAIEQMSRVLAKDLASKNITVNTVSPGATDTEMFREDKSAELIDTIAKWSPFNRLGEPEEIAAAVAFLVSPAAQWVSGQNLRVNGASEV
ncbi:NAD(P)-binding protein [Dendrothele bispora CBS 962.96]|uniref:NAD(P)-binding protein n=1 Tax=Dendrothele bispora (strain CBS 962.96) TaxID=1314807 RepID=A0A4S8LL05_DENBC|nr:NAD(P)-binding protein [Dendrothele bispora CBS 962.96]